MSYAQILSPQTTGDLIGRAIRIYRSNWLPWARLLLWPTIGVLVGRICIQLAATFASESNATANFAQTGLFFLTMLGGVGIVIGFKWLLLLRQLALVRIAIGFAGNFQEAYDFVKKRQWTMLITIIVLVVMVLAVAFLWALEMTFFAILLKFSGFALLGILCGFVGLILSEMFLYFTFYLSLAAIASEDGDVPSLLSRGLNIASQAKLRTLGAGFLISVTVLMLAMPLFLPVFVALMIDTIRLGQSGLSGMHHPYYWQVILAAWETLVEMVTTPLIFLSYGFYYYDLRLRFEGVDVLEQLNQLKPTAEQAR